MNTFDKICTRYGKWVAYGKFPQFRYVRRLAKSNPTDFGKYAIILMMSNFVAGLIRGWAQDKRKKAELEKYRKLEAQVLATQARVEAALAERRAARAKTREEIIARMDAARPKP